MKPFSEAALYSPWNVPRVIQTLGVIRSWWAGSAGLSAPDLLKVMGGPVQMVAASLGTEKRHMTVIRDIPKRGHRAGAFALDSNFDWYVRIFGLYVLFGAARGRMRGQTTEVVMAIFCKTD